MLSNRVRQINAKTRFMVDDKAWPPEQPNNFIPLLLIHYQGHRTEDQVKTMAQLMCSGNIDRIAGTPPVPKHPKLENYKLEKSQLVKILETSKVTKEIKEILSLLEKNEESPFILIEGAPGIGKSVLLKEIAFRWSENQILQNFELVLLIYLRDPNLQQTVSIDDLLQLSYKGDKNALEITGTCSKYLSENGGKSLTLLLDGYDEYPEDLQENSLIADIIKRQVLPHCGLVVSSRPHASEHLHKQANLRVDILGFTEIERENYINQTLKDQPQKIEDLTQYLRQQPSIDSICFVPFNMVVLLYLYKQGVPLPKNATELYNHFICQAICRQLSKLGEQNITDLDHLPEPYNEAIIQLSKLSLKALNNNKLIFTLEEIEKDCPKIADIGDVNGFGLLQAVKHFSLYKIKTTLNFIHFTVQEFLAAYYITHLPPHEELKMINEYFWSDIHFNMFSIYITLTKGQCPSFKTFLSGGNKASPISYKFLKDRLKCLRLYRCFKEAGDHLICNTIEQARVFADKEVNLQNSRLVASDLECISLFLTSSSLHKDWLKLDLWNCHIQDHGLRVLYRALHHSSITIKNLSLMSNALTAQSSFSISEITLNCKVKQLLISRNYSIGEDCRLYSVLTDPYTTLELLGIDNIKLSSSAAISLFEALEYNNTLKVLYVTNNDFNIIDDVSNAITTAIQKNCCLSELHMWGNQITNKAIKDILQALKINDTMKFLWLPKCSQDMQQYVHSRQEAINKERKKQRCQVNLKIEAAIK